MIIKFKNLIVLILVLLLSACSIDVGYRIEAGKVIYERPWNAARGYSINKVEADPETFEILGENKKAWARDKDYVFVGGVKLDFLNPKTFIVLNDLFGKDDKTVVCDFKPIPEADVESFKVKEFKDDSGKKVALGIDKNAAYKCIDGTVSRKESLSIDYFQPIRDNYFKDKTTVWWGSAKLPNVNPDTFRLLSENYGTDGTSAYYLYRPIKGADPKTFKVTGDFQAEDKNHKYEMEDRVE